MEPVSVDVDLGGELREFEVYPPGGGGPVQVQVAHFAYTGTVAMDVGPVVTLGYLAARKAAALSQLTEIPARVLPTCSNFVRWPGVAGQLST